MRSTEVVDFGQAVVGRGKSLFATGGARSLAVVMLLPVLSGIFPSIVLAGGLTSVVSAVELGLLVFSGGASVAIVLVNFDTSRKDGLLVVAAISVVLIPSAALTTALSPTVQLLLQIELFTVLTAIVVCLIGVSIGYETDPRWLPAPGKLGIGLCGVALLDASYTLVFGQPTLTLLIDRQTVLLAAIAAGIGATFVGLVVIARPFLRRRLDLERLRIGSSIALCLVGADLAGLVSGSPAIVAIGCTAILAYKTPSQTDDLAGQSNGTRTRPVSQSGDRQ